MQQLNPLVASLPDSILLGFIYGIAAMGLSLTWKVVKVLDLSRAAIISLGMFGTFVIVDNLSVNPYIGLIPNSIIGFLLGIMIYFGAVHKVVNAPHLYSLLATSAISMILIGIGTAAFTTSSYNMDFSIGSIDLGLTAISWTHLIAAVIVILAAMALAFFLYRTRLGKNIRAVTNDRVAAELMGISSTYVCALSFGLGTMFAAIAGGLIATFSTFNILSGIEFELKSFVICALGGFGNPFGALFGGLFLGTLEGIAPAFMETSWVSVIEFGLFVVILLVRPNGIFGAKE